MITTGQSLRNSVTGETLVFRTTSADTNGESVVVEAFVEPDGAVAAAHVHPSQEERFEVLAGELEFKLGKSTIVAKPGDRVLVPAGTPHRFRNVGEETAHFVCEVSPALGFEQLIETMFALAEDGKVIEEGHAEPDAARGHRPPSLRRRAAPVPARVAPAARARVRRPARPDCRLRADLRAEGSEGAHRARRLVRRRAHRTLTRLLDRLVRPGRRIGQLAPLI